MIQDFRLFEQKYGPAWWALVQLTSICGRKDLHTFQDMSYGQNEILSMGWPYFHNTFESHCTAQCLEAITTTKEETI
jgi:hypothetical protein